MYVFRFRYAAAERRGLNNEDRDNVVRERLELNLDMEHVIRSICARAFYQFLFILLCMAYKSEE